MNIQAICVNYRLPCSAGDETVNLRKAVPEDAPAIAKVHIDFWRSAYRGLLPDDRLAKLEYIHWGERFYEFHYEAKEELDVPMWLEEGLGILIMTEVRPSLKAEFGEKIFRTTNWYSLENIWNDLSGCEDADKAYLQAYKETKGLVEKRGKAEIIRLLYLNQTHYINWNDLPYGEAVITKARRVKDLFAQEVG